MITREEVSAFITSNMRELVDSWEADDITEATLLMGDMNWQSLNIVVLANATQDHYGLTFPFADLLQEIGDGRRKDLSLGEFIDFVYEHVNASGRLDSVG